MLRRSSSRRSTPTPPCARRSSPRATAAVGALERARRVAAATALESDVATRDPRLGPERYAAKLWATLDADLTPDDVLAPRRVRPHPHRGRDRAGCGRLPRRARPAAGRRRRRSYAGRSTPSPRRARSTTRPCCRCARTRSSRPPRSSASTTSSPCTTTRSRSSRCPRSTAASRSPTATRPARSRPRPAHLLRGLADAAELGRRPRRVVLPRVQRPHAAEPHGARGHARATSCSSRTRAARPS